MYMYMYVYMYVQYYTCIAVKVRTVEVHFILNHDLFRLTGIDSIPWKISWVNGKGGKDGSNLTR